MREGLFRALIASAAVAAAALPELQLQYHIRKPLRNPSTMTTAIERSEPDTYCTRSALGHAGALCSLVCVRNAIGASESDAAATATRKQVKLFISQSRAHALRLSRVSTLQLNLHQLQKQRSLRMRLKISKQKMDVSTIARLSNLTMHMIVAVVLQSELRERGRRSQRAFRRRDDSFYLLAAHTYQHTDRHGACVRATIRLSNVYYYARIKYPHRTRSVKIEFLPGSLRCSILQMVVDGDVASALTSLHSNSTNIFSSDLSSVQPHALKYNASKYSTQQEYILCCKAKARAISAQLRRLKQKESRISSSSCIVEKKEEKAARIHHKEARNRHDSMYASARHSGDTEP
ncbi:unnamed protein product [Trichogramma brassicae]|uniref:Uncharacterized protein n=1 Tax=Trichogramma brassicae TaxID=86971 RepID=A0A6H5IWY5_9HYME|nr:unnamed protein product [Trichogramma brassicae]